LNAGSGGRNLHGGEGGNIAITAGSGSSSNGNVYINPGGNGSTAGYVIINQPDSASHNLGRVGIATSTPAFSLDVNGSINFNDGIYQNGIQYLPDITDNGSGSIGIGQTNPQFTLDLASGSLTPVMGNSGGTVGSGSLRIQAGNPSYLTSPPDIGGSLYIDSNSAVVLSNGQGDTISILSSLVSPGGGLSLYNTNSNLRIYSEQSINIDTEAGNNGILTLNASGNKVGIGTNSPTTALTVSGSISSSGLILPVSSSLTHAVALFTGSIFYSGSKLWVYTGTINNYGAGVGWSTASLSI
jgi:hypothetical protein